MSVIGKNPFVNYIIDECSVEQTNQIISIMNNLGTPTEVALYGNQNLLSESNKGVSYVTLKIQDLTKIILNGILIYLDATHCGFFGIANNSDNIVEYKINPANLTFERIYEYLTIEEFRQVCGDKLGQNSGVTEEELTTALATKADKNEIIDVVANPTLTGSEPELTGLQVGNTKYKAGGGGGGIYLHRIRLQNMATGNFANITIYNSKSTAYETGAEIGKLLYDSGYDAYNSFYPLSMYPYNGLGSNTDKGYSPIGVYGNSSSVIKIVTSTAAFSTDGSNVTVSISTSDSGYLTFKSDTVIEM